jgi:uncharacterized iron-regulated membrane protein
MANFLWRATVIVHRYLGVAVGLLMLIWFASGIVMMYVAFPELSQKDRYRVLSPIDWQTCCSLAAQRFDDDLPIRSLELETVAGEPVMFVRPQGQPGRIASLAPTGPALEIDGTKARAIAIGAAERIVERSAQSAVFDFIESDQWTVSDDYGPHRPLYRYAFDDPARTTVYVSSATGEVVLFTTANQRFWNWLGAIPHWFYISALRTNGPLWSQIVIWTSILGGFLTVIGLTLGISQFKRGAGGKLSPYRGWFYWHHVLGLVFGIVTLSWVVSGTISMNPFGFLEGGGGGGAVARLVGAPTAWRDVRASLEAIRTNPPADAVQLTTAPLDGRLFWLAYDGSGNARRLDAGARPAPVSETDLEAAAERMGGASGVASREMIAGEDAYYFSHHDPVRLPAYRVILNDAEHTRFYLDPATASLLRGVDANSRTYRWLFNGLHSLDFAAWLRRRPVWDIIVLALMLGGLAGTITGTYLTIMRIKRDLTFKRPARSARQPAE